MKLFDRIRLLLKAAANDLFGEEQIMEARRTLDGETNAERLTSLLDDAQRQLDVLRLELGNAVSHQKRIERTWQEADAQVKVLDAAADAAVQDGDDDRAREYLRQLQSAQQRSNELEDLAHSVEQHTNELRAAVNQQQERLNVLRHRTMTLTDREKSVTAQAALLGDHQSLTRQTEKLQRELTTWEEQIARREDHLSARREWNK